MSQSPQRILVVKMSSIGDVLLATPVSRALREAFPQAHLAWAVDRRCAPIVEENPYLDELIVMRRDTGRLRDIFSYWAETRRYPPFDWTLDLHGLARSALVTLASRAPFRAGRADAREGSRFAYNRRVVVPCPGAHRVDYYAAFLEELGIPVRCREMILPQSPADEEQARVLLADAGKGAHGSGPWVAMSLTAGRPQKCWPVTSFAQLADRLQQRHGCRVVVLGAPGDRPVADALKAAMATQPVDLVGRAGLKTVAALLRQVDLFISADTGPMHMAAAVKTPVVALFGPTDPALYGPHRVEHIVIRKHCRCAPRWRHPVCHDNECMRAISVEEVEEAALRLLARPRSALSDAADGGKENGR
ncbi:MAG: glycosyltransferase family 9 protein [Armatimonadota bacterium]|nr:glycosyltransferase family 9 protein [Armatimonadota bacterium]